MQENNRTLITIITESSLETTLSRELEKIGVHGYTITDARGKEEEARARLIGMQTVISASR